MSVNTALSIKIPSSNNFSKKKDASILTEYARTHPTITSEQSLQAAAEMLRLHKVMFLPILVEEKYIGIITEHDILHCINHHIDPRTPVKQVFSLKPLPVYPSTPIESVFESIDNTRFPYVILCNSVTHYIGVISAADLISGKNYNIRPKSVYGITSPFGIFLSDGNNSSGLFKYQLFLTGFFYATICILSSLSSIFSISWIKNLNVLPKETIDHSYILLTGLFLCIYLYLFKIFKIHKLKIATIKLIIEGEHLTPYHFKSSLHTRPSKSQVYPIYVFILISLVSFRLIPNPLLNFFIGLGSTVFLYMTTLDKLHKVISNIKPTHAQINTACNAGRDLLEQFQSDPIIHPSFLNKVRKSGLILLVIGAVSSILICYLIKTLLSWDIIVL